MHNTTCSTNINMIFNNKIVGIDSINSVQDTHLYSYIDTFKKSGISKLISVPR